MGDPIEDAIAQGRAEGRSKQEDHQDWLRQVPVEAQKVGNYLQESLVTGLQDLKLTLSKPMDRSEDADARTLELRKPEGFLVRVRIVVPYQSLRPELSAYASFNGKKKNLRLDYSSDQMRFTENIGHFRAAIIDAASELAR